MACESSTVPMLGCCGGRACVPCVYSNFSYYGQNFVPVWPSWQTCPPATPGYAGPSGIVAYYRKLRWRNLVTGWSVDWDSDHWGATASATGSVGLQAVDASFGLCGPNQSPLFDVTWEDQVDVGLLEAEIMAMADAYDFYEPFRGVTPPPAYLLGRLCTHAYSWHGGKRVFPDRPTRIGFNDRCASSASYRGPLAGAGYSSDQGNGHSVKGVDAGVMKGRVFISGTFCVQRWIIPGPHSGLAPYMTGVDTVSAGVTPRWFDIPVPPYPPPVGDNNPYNGSTAVNVLDVLCDGVTTQ